MIRRPRRSLPSTVVALVLLAVCVLVAVACVQSLLGQTPVLRLEQLLAVTSSRPWSSPVTVAAAVLVALVGLVLLVVALSPGKPTVLPLAARSGDDGRPGTDAGVRRHTLAQDLTTVAAGAPGVAKASVKARRRRVTATVTTAAADPAGVPGEVRDLLEARLATIAPARVPAVRVRTRRDQDT